jgi:hypothetical protein
MFAIIPESMRPVCSDRKAFCPSACLSIDVVVYPPFAVLLKSYLQLVVVLSIDL